jgi:2-iminobutanoate/2-iminopropanoate deaminase
MTLPRTVIATAGAPKAIGPYSQAVLCGGFVFCSGQVALDPASGQIVPGGVGEQTRRVLENLSAVVAAAGGSMASVVRCTVFLKSMNDFAAMNEVYATFFPSAPPSRATVEVARLPKDALVEIDCIAAIP